MSLYDTTPGRLSGLCHATGAFALLVAANAATAAPVRDADQAARYKACLALVDSAPDEAIERATQWRGSANGGVPARHCLALAYMAKGSYPEATATLAAAARAAEAEGEPNAGELWGQAGNAAMLAGQPSAAVGDLTSGITALAAHPQSTAALLIDRARAEVDLKQPASAHADLDRATQLDPTSATAWLLKATLARREHDLKAAETAILQAGRYAPDDADVGLEAGNIAAAQGRLDLAKSAWSAVVKGAPGSTAADVAAKALAANQ